MEMVCPLITDPSRDKDYSINLDQSQIPLTFDRQRTFELVGTCTVHIRK